MPLLVLRTSVAAQPSERRRRRRAERAVDRRHAAALRQRVIGLEVVLLERAGLLVHQLRALVLAQLVERAAEVAPGAVVERIEHAGALERGDGLLDSRR